ncbi:hypothetical protein DFH11DRAFT_1588586 [Phellopilus nigrolimitatus]|nr:hypothetical protein DFH11DRAFT_1588586 [Phellopilus nigrolimitatus]
MAFDLTIGTERAQTLQNSIQDELMKRGYSPDADPVMAEYITIMLINNKTADQITAELEDLIGASEYDASFTEWLFVEAAKKSEPHPEPSSTPVATAIKIESAPTDATRRAPVGPRAGAAPIYNLALNQALPSGSQTGQKRSASARSPSPNSSQPNKARRMDLPTAPRAMHGPRSLLDRMGMRSRNGRGGRDEIQARIEAVTNQGPEGAMMNGGGFNNGMGGMMMPGGDMAAAAAAAMGGGIVNPMALQEMMMNQMALMAQMANNMGMLNGQNQFAGPNSFPMMNGMNGMPPDGQNNHQQNGGQQQRRGGTPVGRGRGRGGASSAQWVAPHVAELNNPSVTPSAATAPTSASPPASIVAPTPKAAEPQTASRPGFTPPERPQSPSLCKFALKCTNALCRYSHPSPVATPESGVVLSNDPCPAGKKCTNKDCIQAHVSPAAVGVTSVPAKPKPEPVSTPTKIPCRFGASCLRITSGCPYSHPYTPKTPSTGGSSHFGQQCRFGAGCTRATCSFQHPPGRVLPGTFHRGLAESAPVVSVPTPETGSMSGPSPHRSVIFNKPATATSSAKKEEAEKDKKEAAEVEATVAPSGSKVVQATA